MDELKQLKELLLKEEKENLLQIQIQLNKLDEESKTPQVIIDKLTPLISSILDKSYTKDKELLLKTLSPLVLELIDKNYQESQDKVVKQIAPLITTAIKEQIKSHKDEVVEALYPVIGNMITRYVSKTFEDMLNSINSQIKHGLSFENIFRKIKAKIHGVSETELYLKENASSGISSAFLIDKNSGLVVSHVHNNEDAINEPEMVASMLTAIRSFVNDWIDKNDKFQELGTIEYGDKKILIEASGYSYLAVIANGMITSKTIDKARNVLSKIVLNHSDEIKNFNGDKNSISSKDINLLLSELLEIKKEEKEKKLHPLIYLIPLVFIGWLTYSFYHSNIDNTIKNKVNNIILKTPQLALYRLNIRVEDKILYLQGILPYDYYRELLVQKVQNIPNLESIENNVHVLEVSDNPKEIKDKVSYLVMLFNQKESVELDFRYKFPSLELLGKVWSNNELKSIKNEFSSIEGLSDITYHIKRETPKIHEVIYFDKDSSEILLTQEYKLIKLINLLNRLDKGLVLEVKAYRDNTGSKQHNKLLVENRALNIEKYLKLKGNISQEIKSLGINELPSNIDEKYPGQGRRVVFSLQK
jgi:outer membrane protein OmpA-like peptidoglycan-associated protein